MFGTSEKENVLDADDGTLVFQVLPGYLETQFPKESWCVFSPNTKTKTKTKTRSARRTRSVCVDEKKKKDEDHTNLL